MKLFSFNTLYHVARILLAVIFIPSAFISFYMSPQDMGISEDAAQIVNGFWNTGYLMHVVKLIELTAGILLLTNNYMKIAVVLLMPVALNILLLAIFRDLGGLPVSLIIILLLSLIISRNWQAYSLLLTRN